MLARLERAGVAAHEREAVLEHLLARGYLDDARFAAERARILAERGYGDAYIAVDLEARGVGAEIAGEVVAELAPETERVERALAGRRGAAAARALLRRGFGEEAVTAVAALRENAAGE